ncbi:TetR/AcrR family transcriptional regulator [Mycolicibacterium madagascariense]|nr:TetR/AcrR family transcriptional regulator [Mycolicibacterium madagascariense]MCV7013565.1 TetR family transcriptional regulator [Mycolicibacterium madagascariense]
MGLRERKKVDTRRALSDAALKLALENGLDAVTREDIAREAGVSLRTFTNYFTGKYEALAYRQAERLRRSISLFRARPADEPLWTSMTEAVLGPLDEEFADRDMVDATIPTRGELVQVRKLLLHPDIRTAVVKELFDEWVEAIAERAGVDPLTDMYPRLVTAVVRAVVDTAMDAYAVADPPVAVTTLLRDGMAAVAAGMPEPHRLEQARG